MARLSVPSQLWGASQKDPWTSFAGKAILCGSLLQPLTFVPVSRLAQILKHLPPLGTMSSNIPVTVIVCATVGLVVALSVIAFLVKLMYRRRTHSNRDDESCMWKKKNSLFFKSSYCEDSPPPYDDQTIQIPSPAYVPSPHFPQYLPVLKTPDQTDNHHLLFILPSDLPLYLPSAYSPAIYSPSRPSTLPENVTTVVPVAVAPVNERPSETTRPESGKESVLRGEHDSQKSLQRTRKMGGWYTPGILPTTIARHSNDPVDPCLTRPTNVCHIMSARRMLYLCLCKALKPGGSGGN